MTGARPAVRRPGIPGDYHVHTTFSDGAGGVDECVERAIALGLPEIGIADHLAAVQTPPWGTASIAYAELDGYVSEVRDAAARHDEIVVLLGVEAEYVPEHEGRLKELLAGLPLDFAIGGVHVVDGFEFDDAAKRHDERWSDPDELFIAYYQTVQRAVESGCFDVIAHLDYIGLWGHVPGPAVADAIQRVLDAMADAGCALELNTDRISDPAGVMYPAYEILTAAGSRAIPLVIDSDAHEPGDVGLLWDEAIGLAVRAGFTETLRLSDRTLVPLGAG